jgi:hypothetical protein
MASVTVYPASASQTTTSKADWANINNVLTQNASSSRVSSLNFNPSEDLTVNFPGVSLPPGATIDGIKIEKLCQSEAATVQDTFFYFNANGKQSSNLQKGIYDAYPSSATWVTYGGAADTIGLSSPVPADFVSGFNVQTACWDIDVSNWAEIDTIRVTIYYTNNPATFTGYHFRGVIPVGCGSQYCKNLGVTPALTDEFNEVNGQTVNDTQSNLHNTVLPNFNGSGGGIARFLRGSTDSGTQGGAGTHTHTRAGVNHTTGWAWDSCFLNCSGNPLQAASNNPAYFSAVNFIRIK